MLAFAVTALLSTMHYEGPVTADNGDYLDVTFDVPAGTSVDTDELVRRINRQTAPAVVVRSAALVDGFDAFCFFFSALGLRISLFDFF